MAHKVLVSDKLSEAGLDILNGNSEIEVDYRPGLNEDELAEAIGEYDGLIIRSGSKVTAKVLGKADQLRAIGRAGIGVDNIDVPVASKRGIVVMNTPTKNSVTTAEHAITLMLSMSRKVAQATASMKAGKWEKSKFQGREITDRVLGIIGLGNIGKIVANRAQGLHMNVIAFDPVLTPEQASELGVELVSLDELYARAEFITIHAPKTATTAGLLNDEAFAKMNDGVFIVNAARGGIVDEAALARALDSGKVAGAALDVFEKEPIDPKHPLLGYDQVTLTPHLGASTKEAQTRVAVEIAEQLVDYLVNGTIKNSVNIPSLTAEDAEKLEPYLLLSERIGSLLGQLGIEGVREVRVTATGEPGELGLSSIRNSVLAGFLGRQTRESINPVSAPFEAKERGFTVKQVSEDASNGFLNTVRVVVSAETGLHTATGTIGAEGEPRLASLDGRPLDALLEGDAIVLRNQNRPGVIGAVGSILGKHEVNVARVQVRPGPDGKAVGIWSVDSRVPQDALEEIRGLEQVTSVIPVKL